jgi:hypothetical protein
MSDDEWDIAPPPFKPEAALETMRRFARDQRVLTERSEGWLLGANLVLKLALAGDTLHAQLAKRAARTPEWDRFEVSSHPQMRKLQDELKRRLVRWKGEE